MEFNNKFKEQLLSEKPGQTIASHSEITDVLNKPSTRKEVTIVCEKAKLGKAIGIDKTANELLKHKNSVELLYNFLGKVFQLGLIPEHWSNTIIHLIPKESGRVTNPLLYCGLALQCCIMKLLSGILNNRIVNHLNSGNLLQDEQNGFTRDRSCQQQIYTLTTVVRNRICENLPTYCAFVNFRKAFDVVDRALLLYRLETMGITGKILNLISELYSKTENMLCINNVLSDKFDSKTG